MNTVIPNNQLVTAEIKKAKSKLKTKELHLTWTLIINLIEKASQNLNCKSFKHELAAQHS
jgi:hypothetical protein